MPDEVTEQSEPVITGAEEAVVGAPEGVADITVESVAGDSAAVAEVPVMTVLASDEAIRAEAERNEVLRGYLEAQRLAGINTGMQRARAEAARNEGTVDRARAVVRSVGERLARGEDPEDIAKDLPPHVNAVDVANRVSLMRALLHQAGELGDPTARELAESLTGDPEELTKAAQATLHAYGTRKEADAIASLTLDKVPKGSALEEAINARIAAGIAAEREAEQREAMLANASNPPAVSGSGPSVGITNDTALAMDAQAMALLSDEDYARVKSLRLQAAGMA